MEKRRLHLSADQLRAEGKIFSVYRSLEKIRELVKLLGSVQLSNELNNLFPPEYQCTKEDEIAEFIAEIAGDDDDDEENEDDEFPTDETSTDEVNRTIDSQTTKFLFPSLPSGQNPSLPSDSFAAHDATTSAPLDIYDDTHDRVINPGMPQSSYQEYKVSISHSPKIHLKIYIKIYINSIF